MITIERAQDWHAEAIAANARQADIDELWAIARVTPLEAMRGGVRLSQAQVALVDGEPVAMFGVTPISILLGRGLPWMVASSALDTMRLKKALLRESVLVLRRWQCRYDFLLNFVDARNESAIRWLKWIGFTVQDETRAMGEDGLPFHAFYWRKDVYPDGGSGGCVDGDDGHWRLPTGSDAACCGSSEPADCREQCAAGGTAGA